MHAIVQAPLHVRSHVPEEQLTRELAPTVNVHLAPAHVTSLFSPVVPEHVELDSQVSFDDGPVEPKSHVCPDGQSHEFPLHTDEPHAGMLATTTTSSAAIAAAFRDDLASIPPFMSLSLSPHAPPGARAEEHSAFHRESRGAPRFPSALVSPARVTGDAIDRGANR